MQLVCIDLPFTQSSVANIVWLNNLHVYKTMLNWLYVREVDYKLTWSLDGKYFPLQVTMDDESATAFRLVFDV